MVFGMSTTTLVVMLGAGALALGPKDVPLVARFLGRIAGRAVSHVTHASRAFERAAADADVGTIRADIRASMRELRGVATEIEEGLNPLRAASGTLGREGRATTTTTTTTTNASRRTLGNDASHVRARQEASAAASLSIPVIPVSARVLGATPSSGTFGSSGADILAASFKEREVAFKAMKLMKSGEIDAYLSSTRDGDGKTPAG
jgi:Sec-independent protein translocase protein TatA